MTIRTEINQQWREVLETLPAEQQQLLIDEADHLASAVAYRNHHARLSTNGALEVMFSIGCWQNRVETLHAMSPHKIKGEPQ